MDKSLIETYAAGGLTLAKAIEGLDDSDLDAIPIPGTWSIRQIVVHLMDSDLVASDRMKRIAAMDKPLLMGYDETAFANLPGSQTIDAHLACDIFAKNRRLTAHILRHLPDAAFDRFGIHSENGKVTLAYMVPAYIEHLEHHMRFLRQKRQRLGKPVE